MEMSMLSLCVYYDLYGWFLLVKKFSYLLSASQKDKINLR